MQAQQHAPFFKLPQQVPLLGSAERSLKTPRHNSFSQQHHPLRQVTKQQQQQQETVYKQQEQRQKQREEVYQQEQHDKLSVLHCRLQQEADKIRKWKNAIELELQQKDRQLKDVQQLADAKQKSLLETQLRNDSLSTQLQDEMANQKDIQRKITATRDLCHALKMHVERVEKLLTQGEADRNTLSEANQQRVCEYQELVERFEQLQLRQTETHGTLKRTVSEERTKNADLVRQLEDHTVQNNAQVSCLQQQNSQLQLQVQQLIQEKADQLATMINQQRALESELQLRSEMIVAKQGELENCHGELTQIKEEASSLRSQCENDQEEIMLLREQVQTQLNEYQSSEQSYQQQLSELKDQLSKLQQCMEEESSRFNLIKAELEQQKTTANSKCDELQDHLTHSTSQCTKLEESVAALQESLDQLTQKHKNTSDELTLYQSQLAGAQKMLQQKEADIEELCQKMSKSVDEEQSKVAGLAGQLAESNGTVHSLLAQKKDLEAALCCKEKSLEEMQTKTEDLVAELKESARKKCCVETELKLAQDEIGSSVAAQNELTDQLAQLQDKLCLQEELIRTQTTKNAELEAMAQTQTQSLTTMNTEVKNIKEQLCQQEFNSNSAAAILQQKLTEKQNDYLLLQTQNSKVTAELEVAQKREEEAKSMCDAQIGELCRTLEKYKEENAHIVSQRDKEIDNLKERQAAEALERDKLQNSLEIAKEMVQQLKAQKESIESELLSVKKPANKKQSIDMTPITTTSPPSTPKYPSNYSLKEACTPVTRTPSRRVPPLHRPRIGCSVTPTSREISSEVPISPCVVPTPNRTRPRLTAVSKTPLSTAKLTNVEASCDLEKRQFKELYPDIILEDEAIFKRPRGKTLSQSRSAAAKKQEKKPYTPRSNTRGSSTKKGAKTAKASSSKKIEPEMSWFDLDPVFGFGPED